jgi:hypothetical protein
MDRPFFISSPNILISELAKNNLKIFFSPKLQGFIVIGIGMQIFLKNLLNDPKKPTHYSI